jgi:poly-gamma-glutamate capsule biosynthesis protein CapA/YwtB (metallophosphatase superfamily)
MSEPVLHVGFSGDVSFTGVFARPAPPEARFAPEVAAFLRASHHNVVNVEGPLTDRPPDAAAGPGIASPPGAAAGVMPFLNARVWNLANNHALDSGPAGLEDTLAMAAREGARTLGAGRTLDEAAAPVVLEGEGVRVGLLAVCDGDGAPAGPGTPGVLGEAREALVRTRLAELRRSCDHVVLNYHGGEEYSFVPMPARRRRLLRYLEMGASVVVAHHAHTVQGWERTERGSVFYGLGNFVFDHPALLRRPGTYTGVLLRLSFTRGAMTFTPLFTRADRGTGRITEGAPLPAFAPVEPAGLRAAWCREAHRLVTLPRGVAAENRLPVEPAPPAATAPVPARGTPAAGRLRSVLYAARSPVLRALVLGAVEHRLRSTLGGRGHPPPDTGGPSREGPSGR